MFCQNCGKEIKSERTMYCPFCGTATKKEASRSMLRTEESRGRKKEKKVKRRNTDRCKRVGLFIILFGIAVGAILYFSCAYLADSYKGLPLTSGYYANGEYHELDSGVVGGNSEAVEIFEQLQMFGVISGVILVIIGVIWILIGVKKDLTPIHRKRGSVLECDSYSAIIEFEDGNRSRCTILQDQVILMPADRGVFEIKGKQIVGFFTDADK